MHRQNCSKKGNELIDSATEKAITLFVKRSFGFMIEEILYKEHIGLPMSTTL